MTLDLISFRPKFYINKINCNRPQPFIWNKWMWRMKGPKISWSTACPSVSDWTTPPYWASPFNRRKAWAMTFQESWTSTSVWPIISWDNPIKLPSISSASTVSSKTNNKKETTTIPIYLKTIWPIRLKAILRRDSRISLRTKFRNFRKTTKVTFKMNVLRTKISNTYCWTTSPAWKIINTKNWTTQSP